MTPLPSPKQILAVMLTAVFSAGDLIAKMPSVPQLAPSLIPKVRGVEDDAEKAVNARLLCDGTALVPGRAATIGITFDIAPGWNLYWRNPGDSGLPISVKFDSPPGITIGEALWPVPEREVLPGDILDYIYRRRVTLLFPVAASPTLSPSSGSVTIKADLKWLVCKEACVPGARSIEMTIPISSIAEASKDLHLIESARQRLPRSSAEQPTPMVSVKWAGRTLEVSCTGAEELIFFPYEGDPQPEDALVQGRRAADRLRLSYNDAETGVPVRGVLEVRRSGQTTFHKIESPPVPPGP